MSFKLNNFEEHFPRYIVNRGYQYYRNGLIIQSLYDKQSMIHQGIVSGTENYLVKIKITDNNLVEYYSCNCPYHSDCKHITAYLYYLRESKVNQYQENSEETMAKSYYDELYQNIITYYESNDNYFGLNKIIDKFRFKGTISYGQDFDLHVFELFRKLIKQINQKDLKKMLKSYLEHHYNNHPYQIQEILRSNKEEIELYYLYYELIFLNFFNYHLISNNNIYDIFADTFEYTLNIKLFVRILGTDFFKRLTHHFEYTRNKNVNFSVLLNFFKDKTLEKLKFLETAFSYEDINDLLSLGIDNELISIDLAVYLLDKYQIRTKDKQLILNSKEIKENLTFIKTNFKDYALKYLTSSIKTDKLSRREIINKLETIKLVDEDFDFRADEILYIMALDNEVISNLYSLKMFQEGLPSLLKKLYEPKRNANYYPKDNHYGLLFYLEESSNLLKFSVIDNNFNVILIASIKDSKIQIEYSDDYLSSDEILNTLYHAKITVVNDNAFTKLYYEVIKVQEQRLLEERTNVARALVKELSRNLLEKPEVILENKVDIEIIMSFHSGFNYKNANASDNLYYAEDFLYGMKIGNQRLYFVKDNVSLLNAIENKTFHKYGAQLAFDHNIESFTESARSYLNVLSKYFQVDKIKNNLGLILSHQNSYELTKLLKGKTITLHNHFDTNDYEEYYVKKEDFKVSVTLTDTSLETNLNSIIKKGLLVKTPSFDFVLDKEKRTLNIVDYPNKKIKTLSDFVLKHNNFRTDLVIDDLVREVIPLISEDIKISDKLKTKIADLKVLIDSYFDYDDELDLISVKTKYFRNNLELKDENLQDHQLIIKNYLSILETFGFKDNKITDQAYIINFLSADLNILKRLGNVYVSEAITNKKVKSLSKVQVSVTLDGGMLKAAIESVDLTNSELKEVLNAYKRGKKYVILRDNVILTSDQSIIDLKEFLDLNELSDKDLSKPLEKPIYEVFKLETSDGIDLIVENKIKTIMDDIVNYDQLVYKEPKMYELLKNYQKSGFKWLKTLAKYNLGGILADDMGLGKTLQVISYLESEEFNLSIVISPKSLIYNWENEIKKFNATFKALVYVGSIEERKTLLKQIKNNKEKLLVITSYDTLRNDLDSFKTFDFTNIILDEAQAIKTRTALKTKAVKELKGLNKFVLTGTPIENSIFDLWSIFDFIMPGYLYSHSKFNSLGLKVHEEDTETLNFLINKTKPFILRRVKSDVLKELPEKEEQVIYTTFDGENRKVYNSYLLNVQEKLNDKEVKQIEILSDLMRLRQLCISPSLVYDNYQGESLKIEAATNLINEAINSNHKVLVFSTFVKALDLLKENYHENDYFLLTGKTDAGERVRMTEEFNNPNSSKKVFFISLKAGGTGLNLTGADIVIHLDPWWNLAAENQATDRAHRIGQENTVNVYKIVMKDSIEERIIELQNKKKDLFDKMIDHDEELTKFSKDDYSYILK